MSSTSISGGLKTSPTGKRNPDSANVCSVVVAYADTATRDRAMLLCDHLVEKLWEDVDFDITWWRFDYLSDSQIAVDGAAAARRADMIIFCARADRELTPAVRTWVETWAVKRENQNSALVALIGADNEVMQGISPLRDYLRDVARRARMDFLSDVPDTLTEEMNGSVEAMMHRAATVTSVMERILQQASPPTHWGINE